MDIVVEISLLIVLSFTIFIVFTLILALPLIPLPYRSRRSDSEILCQPNKLVSDNSRAAVGVFVRV